MGVDMLTAVAPSVGDVNVAVRLAACAIRGTAIAASAISKTIEVSRRDGVFMTPHLSNLSSIDSLTNGAAENRRITRKLRLETMVFPECAGLKCGRRHDLCEHTSLAICFQLEVLQSGTILIKAPLAGIVATHSRENVALMLSLLPAHYMSWLIQIPSCRHDARCGCTFRTSAARPRAQPGLRRERLQSSSSLQRALSYAWLLCPISDRASRVAQNSWLRLVVEQLGVQNLVIIDFEWN